jgi:hypothetical protein
MAINDSFNYAYFKNVMKIADEDDAIYALTFRSTLDHINVFYGIDIDALITAATDIDYELQLAIFKHVKHQVQLIQANADLIGAVTDAQGGRTTYDKKIPKDVIAVYKAYSTEPPAYL